MSVSIWVRIKSLFAHDKYAFWWNEITDKEKTLAGMDAWELAAVIKEATGNRIDMVQERIVAEHMLNVRLAKIQARPGYLAVYVGIAGAIGGALLTSSFQPHQEPSKCVCECQHGGSIQQNKSHPIKPETSVRKMTNIPKN